MRFRKVLFALAVAGAPSLVYAHGPESHQAAGANGGQVVAAGGHHVELVVKDGSLIFYVTNEANQPESTTNAAGRVTVQASAKPVLIPLVAVEPNQLIAKIVDPITAGTKLVMSAKLPDGHDLQVRFVSK